MSVDERIELLKSNILHYTKDLLHFDVVEIRLLDQKTNHLEPLLAVGMEPEAEKRTLYALNPEQRRDRFCRRHWQKAICAKTRPKTRCTWKGVKAPRAR